MVTFLLFVFASIGMAHIICDSTLFAPVRNSIDSYSVKAGNKGFWHFLHQIVNCYQCCGFWTGLFMGVVLLNPVNPAIWFAAACAGSYLSLLAGQYFGVLEARAIVLENEIDEE